MRKVEICLYKFEELSKEVQETVIDEYVEAGNGFINHDNFHEMVEPDKMLFTITGKYIGAKDFGPEEEDDSEYWDWLERIYYPEKFEGR